MFVSGYVLDGSSLIRCTLLFCLHQPGSWGNVTTLSGFQHHLLRRDYGSWKLYSGDTSKGRNAGLQERTLLYLKDLTFRQGIYVIPAIAAIGCLLAVAALLMELPGLTTNTAHTPFGSHSTTNQIIAKRRVRMLLSSACVCHTQQSSDHECS
jgi:hypothetical protein